MGEKTYYAARLRLIAFILIFAMLVQILNAEMVLAQVEMLGEIIEDIGTVDEVTEDTGNGEEPDSEGESDDETENEPDDIDNDEEAYDKEEDEEDDLLLLIDPPAITVPDFEIGSGMVIERRIFPPFFLDITEFSDEAISLVFSGRPYSDLDEWERFVLRDQVFVREDTMLALEAFGYSIYSSIPIARIMQQLELNVHDAHTMIANYGGLDGPVYEANAFRQIVIQSSIPISDADRAEIVSFIAAGHGAEHVMSTYIMSLALDMPLSFLMRPQQVFDFNSITLMEINPPREDAPSIPAPELPSRHPSDDEDEGSDEDYEDSDDEDDEYTGFDDESNDENDENAEKPSESDDNENSYENEGEEESGLEAGSLGLANPRLVGSAVANAGQVHPVPQLLNSVFFLPMGVELSALEESEGLNGDENENPSPEEPDYPDYSENDDEITEPEDDDEAQDPDEDDENEEPPSLPNNLLPDYGEEDAELLSELDLHIIISLANQYQIHPDILINFIIENGMNGQSLRSFIRLIQRLNGIVIEEEFSMIDPSVQALSLGRSAATPPDIGLSWRYPASPFSYKGSFSEVINLNTGALIYTDHIVTLPGRGGFDLNLSLIYDSSQSSNDFYWGEINNVNVFMNGHFFTESWNNVPIPITRYVGSMEHSPRCRFIASGWTFNTTRIFRDDTTFIHGILSPNPLRFIRLADGRTIEIETTGGTANLRNYNRTDLRLQADNFASFPGSVFILTYADGTREFLNQTNLVARTDRFGNTIQFIDSDHRLTIIDSNNQQVIIDFPANHFHQLMRVTLPDASIIEYTITTVPMFLNSVFIRHLTEKRDQHGRITRFEYQLAPYNPNFFSRTSQTRQFLSPAELDRLTVFRFWGTGITGWFGSPLQFYARHGGPSGVDIHSYNNHINSTFVFGSNHLNAATNPHYSNLVRITYPTGMVTTYVYGQTFASLHAMGHKEHYYVRERFDTANGMRFNHVTYTMGAGGNSRNNFSGMSLTNTVLTELPTTYFYYMTERRGEITTTYRFNHRHLLVEQRVVGAGVTETTIFTYDQFDLPVTVVTTVSSGFGSYTTTERFQHDSYGNITAHWSVLADGSTADLHRTSFTYDRRFNLMTGKTYRQDANTLISETFTLSPDGRHVSSFTRTVNGMQTAREEYTVNSFGMLTGQRSFYAPGRFIEESFTYTNNTHLASRTVGEAVERFTYDRMGNLLTHIDPNGNLTSHNYDRLNRLTHTFNPDGTNNVITYNDIANTVTVRDEMGFQIMYTFNPLGLLTTVTDLQTGHVLGRVTYDSFMNILTEADANGVVTTYRYDGLNRLIEIRTGSHVETFAHQSGINQGNKVIRTLQGDAAAPSQQSAAFTDRFGRLAYESVFLDGQELRTRFTYDFLGNILTTLNPRDAALGHSATTRFTYQFNSLGLNLITENALDYRTEEQSDWLGRTISTRDALGNIARMSYNNRSLLAEIRTPFEGGHYRVQHFTYDLNGNIISERTTANRPGQAARYIENIFAYDSMNRLIRTETGGERVEFTYDRMGRQTSVRNAGGSRINRFEYDHRGNLIRTIDPMGQEETFEHDRNGNVIRRTDRNGTVFTTTYDNMNRPIETRAVSADGTIIQQVRTTFSVNGLLISTENENETTTNRYDSLGRLVEETTSDGTRRVYTYDVLGSRTGFELFVNGNRILNQVYEYDRLSRLTAVSSGSLREAIYQYDGNNNRISRQMVNGVTTTYTYNQAGLMTSLVNRNNQGIISSYTYTYFLDGNQATIIDHTGRLLTYVYDNQNRLVSEIEQRPNGEIITRSFTFDNAGNRASKTVVENGETTVTAYTYDLNNRLTRIHEHNQQTGSQRMTGFTYDPNGNQLATTSSGTSPRVGAGEAGLNLHVHSLTVFRDFAHLQDELRGTIRSDGTTRLTTRLATQADHDNLDELLAGTISSQDIPLPSIQMMVLNNDSDTTFTGSAFSSRYTYDLFNRLIRIDRPGLRAEYAYRADGMRISKTVNGIITRHVWDGLNIVADVEADGTIIDTYIRGVGLIRSLVHGYYVFNARGDVVQITNAIGWVTRDYEYDAFGNQLDRQHLSNEADTNPWRFSGEYFDIESGLVYLRARFYNPVTGRFITEDPHWGVHNMIFGDNPATLNGQPMPDINAIRQSANLFVYAGNNPIKFVDPSGLFFIMQSSSGIFSIRPFNSINMALNTVMSILPIGGTITNQIQRAPNPSATVVGEASWGRAGSGFAWSPSPGADLIMDAGMYGFARGTNLVTSSRGGAIASSLFTAGMANDRLGHSNTIMGLMEVHNVNNRFSDLTSLTNQIARFDNIIMNNPDYFFFTTQYGIMHGNFSGSQFLRDLELYRMEESIRSQIFRQRARVSPSNWTVDDFNSANNALMTRLRRQ